MARSDFTTLLLLILTLLIPGTGAFADTTWTSFRGPEGVGEAALRDLPTGDGPLALEVRWKRALGSGYSGIAVADDTLITAFYRRGEMALRPGSRLRRARRFSRWTDIDAGHCGWKGFRSQPLGARGRHRLCHR